MRAPVVEGLMAMPEVFQDAGAPSKHAARQGHTRNVMIDSGWEQARLAGREEKPHQSVNSRYYRHARIAGLLGQHFHALGCDDLPSDRDARIRHVERTSVGCEKTNVPHENIARRHQQIWAERHLPVHWCWIKCERCPHMRAVVITPFVIRRGPEAGHAAPARTLQRMGYQGVALQHPNWGGSDTGWALGRLSKCEQLADSFCTTPSRPALTER